MGRTMCQRGDNYMFIGTSRYIRKELLLFLFCSIVSVITCHADPLRVKEVLNETSKYANRQIQVAGKVERWIEQGDSEKTGLYVLRDNFGDDIKVRTVKPIPVVGDRVTVNGLLIRDEKHNKTYLQDVNDSSASSSQMEAASAASSNTSAMEYVKSNRSLIAVAGIGFFVFAFIIFIATRVGKTKNKVIDVPDFSFDETQTVMIDVNGKFDNPVSVSMDESTVIMMPGHFEATKGPKEFVGQKFYLTSLITKVGREEAGVDKSIGWIKLPASCTSISRYQADIVYKDKVCHIDHKSKTTETRVNGSSITLGHPVPLANGTTIDFGSVELKFIIVT